MMGATALATTLEAEVPHASARKVFFAACLALLSACTAVERTGSRELAATTERNDGSVINWTLSSGSGGRPRSVLLVLQGSGCAPTRLNQNIQLLKAAMPEYAVLTIEKYGVDLGAISDDSMNGCSTDFYANHTITRSVEDAKLVLRDLRSRKLWDRHLLVFGGSEGGAVASILSHEIEGLDAVIVFSTGTGLTMAEFFPMVVPPPVARQMQAVFDQARSNPKSSTVVGGNSLRWWADILDRRLSDDLLKSAIPILLIHGENDRQAPVVAARATQRAFVDAGQVDRLTYWELADRDHHMRDPSGRSRIEEVFRDVASWVRARGLSPA